MLMDDVDEDEEDEEEDGAGEDGEEGGDEADEEAKNEEAKRELFPPSMTSITAKRRPSVSDEDSGYNDLTDGAGVAIHEMLGNIIECIKGGCARQGQSDSQEPC